MSKKNIKLHGNISDIKIRRAIKIFDTVILSLVGKIIYIRPTFLLFVFKYNI